MARASEAIKSAILKSVQENDGISVVQLAQAPALRGFSEGDVSAGLRALRTEQRLRLGPDRRALHFSATKSH